MRTLTLTASLDHEHDPAFEIPAFEPTAFEETVALTFAQPLVASTRTYALTASAS